MGNPWLLREIADAFCSQNIARTPSTLREKIPYILRHCEFAVKYKGEERGIVEMRRHFAGYVKGFDGAKEMRMRLMGAISLKDVVGVLQEVQ